MSSIHSLFSTSPTGRPELLLGDTFDRDYKIL
jgi:hypothetical protein